MTEIVKEINGFICREHPHAYDAEDPPEAYSFSTCIEEKKYLLKNIHRGRRYFGKHIPILWRNNEPLLTLGPHCNIIHLRASEIH